MAVTYRAGSPSARTGSVAFLDVLRTERPLQYCAGLLVSDARTQPLEFVHNRVEGPSGILWPRDLVASAAIRGLVHSLFDACRESPDLVVCHASLGPAEFCRDELAPSIPFARVAAASDPLPLEVVWVSPEPTPGMRAGALLAELAGRSLLLEPFERVGRALREVYPEVTWLGGAHDPARE